MESFDIEGVQSVIGYTFKNADLLVSALTHSSYINEHPGTANERLEFLGDCVLNFLVGVELYISDPSASEATLSSKRAATVSRTPLAALVDGMGLLKYLRVGAGVDKSAFSEKTRSNVYEAVLGAIYLDGGLDACKAFLADTFYKNVEPERDYKSELQNLSQKYGRPVYETAQIDGGFCTELTVLGKVFSGFGKSKHASEIDAARLALSVLSDKKR